MVFAQLVPALVARTKPGGVYMGVGPEQNFTYIVNMKGSRSNAASRDAAPVECSGTCTTAAS